MRCADAQRRARPSAWAGGQTQRHAAGRRREVGRMLEVTRTCAVGFSPAHRTAAASQPTLNALVGVVAVCPRLKQVLPVALSRHHVLLARLHVSDL